MRMKGRVGNQDVVVLIDSSSTHNFLDSSVVKNGEIPMNSSEKIRLRVTNGEQVLNEGRCATRRVKVQGNVFITNAFVLVLVGCDMVLGVQ